jgi:phage integrase, N-terminal SAM-like domain
MRTALSPGVLTRITRQDAVNYKTARAYYADLQDIFEWAVERDKDVLALEDRDLRQYCALLRRRKYSENTIRRRMVAWRKLQTRMDEEEVDQYGK